MKVAIIGNGHVGSALQRGIRKSGHDATAVGHDADQMREAASPAEVIVFAVPFGALSDAVWTLGDATRDKVVVDATNVLTGDMKMALGFTTSGAEELQKKMPTARVVKAFNTVFAVHMDSGQLNGRPLSTFVAGDDAGAKATVMELARGIGFDAIDAGPLQNARMLEPLGYLNIQLAFTQHMGTGIGLVLLH